MKIDIYAHIIPVNYKDALFSAAPSSFLNKDNVIDATPMVYDLDLRFRLMDKHDDLAQVLTLAAPPIEEVVSSEKAVDLAKVANDEMAALVAKYPDRFVAAVAALPMNDIDEALKEADRAITGLGLRGIQLFTPIKDKPLDSPEFMPLYEKMSQYDLPIWIHPMRTAGYADYRTEEKSLYALHALFGWPFETAAAMTRLVFNGVLEKWTNLKIITHHCGGGMVPFFEERIISFYGKLEKLLGEKYRLSQAPIEYFKMFYADTALYGNTPALMCGSAFFGADHLLFGTDMPLGDEEGGWVNTRKTIDAIERMGIGDSEKKKIFMNNAKKLLLLEK